jgi:hypothetical protein
MGSHPVVHTSPWQTPGGGQVLALQALHSPMMQVSPDGQALPQPPQLLESSVMMTHWPLHSTSGAAQPQTPGTPPPPQVWPPVQLDSVQAQQP